MERKEAYEQIKKLGLQEECKKQFGKNFTQCKTDELIHLIQSFTIKEKKNNEVIKKTTKSSVEDLSTLNTCCDYEKDKMTKIEKLVKVLWNKHILLASEAKEILG